MISRRSFFKRLGAFVAVVALAPQIAFARKMEEVTISKAPFWTQTTRYARCYSSAYVAWRNALLDEALMRQ